jgi:diguanylate cyclase (GGDEF)-like protein/PAS domain S-box-containing protein
LARLLLRYRCWKVANPRYQAEELQLVTITAEAMPLQAEQPEATPRENELRHRMLAENSPLAMQILAPDGTTLCVNLAWERLWGVPFSAVRRHNVLQDPQLAEQGLLPLLEKALAGECVELPIHQYDQGVAANLPNPRGKRWLRVLAYPSYGPDGALREVVLIQEDVTERVLAEEAIRNLAYFDALTHLPNRRLLMDRLEQALIASRRSGEYGAVLMLDLDHFKTLNDTQGHAAGDQLLKEVAQRLKAAVRRGDTVARLGGDEFVVVLQDLGEPEETAANEAERLAEKIRGVLDQSLAVPAGRAECHTTASIGVMLFRGQDTQPDELLQHADVALYQAKGAGGNAIRFFNPTMQAAIDARLALAAALRSGLEEDGFQLLYQPQVDRDGDLVGAEALLRWHSPSRGLVLPDDFIPVAEDTGIIVAIGKRVLDAACAQLKAWQAASATRNLRMSVNVSARQIIQYDFVAQVEQSLSLSGADPIGLTLELKESVVLDNVEQVTETMRLLDVLGVAFALDNFGTGYSSLSCLKRLPLRQLKIDRSFVHDILDDPNAAAIVRTILAMGQSLGLEVIAEGVATEGQRDLLQYLGCSLFQGYLFGEPAQIDAQCRFLEIVANESDNGHSVVPRSDPQ